MSQTYLKSLFDLNGRVITNLVKAEQPAGGQSVNWSEVANVPTGMYIANLQTTEGRMFIRVVVN